MCQDQTHVFRSDSDISRVCLSVFAHQPGQLIGNSDLLRAGGFGVRTLAGEIFPDRSTQALRPAQPSCAMDDRFLCWK